MDSGILEPINTKRPGKALGRPVVAEWDRTPSVREFDAFVVPEDDGGFSVFAVHYPGIVSQGDSVKNALENIAEAFSLAAEVAAERGEALEFSSAPWVDVPHGCDRFRVRVDG